MYALYHFPLSPSARRVVALLEAAAIPYELRHVALDQGEQNQPAFRAVNPNGQVPTLVDGDLVIHESNAILRYLCQKHGLEDWYPADPAPRARTEQWLDWSQCRLFPGMAEIIFNKLFLGPNGDPAAIARGQARVAQLAPILEAGLDGRPFLVGDAPTIADLAVDSCITQLGMTGDAPSSPNIKAWHARVNAIPGVQASCRALATPEPA